MVATLIGIWFFGSFLTKSFSFHCKCFILSTGCHQKLGNPRPNHRCHFVPTIAYLATRNLRLIFQLGILRNKRKNGVEGVVFPPHSTLVIQIEQCLHQD